MLKFEKCKWQEDDERTIDEDEAKITEAERKEELAALEAEADLPLEEILKAYSKRTTRCESHFELFFFSVFSSQYFFRKLNFHPYTDKFFNIALFFLFSFYLFFFVW